MAGLSGPGLRALAQAVHSFDDANLINTAVIDAVATGTLPSNAGAVTIGTNTTDKTTVIGLLIEQANAGLTALIGGGQAGATQITGNYARIATVTSPADSVALPASVVGLEVTVVNDGANSAQVFGLGTDTINGVATATGVPQAAGAIVKYICFVAGNWETSASLLPAHLDNTVTTGTGTMVAGAMEGAQFVTLTASGQAAITLTTRTAAQIQAKVPSWKLGSTYTLRIINKNSGTLTTAGGSNVTMTSTIPPNSFADYTVTFSSATAITTNQVTVAPIGVLPPSQFTSINVTTGTLGASQASGAAFVCLTSTNSTPGSQAMRTPAQVLADSLAAGLSIGMSYVLRIANTGAGTFTLATDSGAGFTMTGDMTIPVNTYTDFVVTINTATTGTVQEVASGTSVTPLPPSQFTSINVTTGTLAAGNASGAAEVFLTSTNATPGSQAMRTPAQILTDTPSLTVGMTYTLRVVNTGAGTFTLATDSGAGFTMTGTMTVPFNTFRDFTVTINTATTGTVQSVGSGPAVSPLPIAKFTSLNVTTGTLAAGNASGAQIVNILSTNSTPGSQAMRTPAQVLTDTPGLVIGMTYMLRIANSGAGTWTLATDSGAGFTMTGTMTVLTNTFRDFMVTISTGTTGIVQSVGAGDYS